MTAQIIDGKAIAARVQEQVRAEIERDTALGMPLPALATVLVGADAASQIYVRHKRNACKSLGIRSVPVAFAADVSEAVLLAEIDRLNADDTVDGILVQLPLPHHLNSTAVIERIRPDKDVDGFHPYNVGRLAQRNPVLSPCTPAGIMEMLRAIGETFYGRRAVIVGASNIVGRPMAMELLLAGAVVTITHRFTHDLAADVGAGEILVVATGKPQLVKGTWVREGATVIDVGISRMDDGSLCGDVEFAAAKQRAAWITPVPGGVGPMTVAQLMRNTLTAARMHHKA